jgi:hypothetical protein
MSKVNQLSLPLTCATTLALVTACSDTTTLETGGGAGDAPANPQAVAVVTPFAGIYDLPDNWSGNSADEAFLEIRQPNDAGTAIALLHDWDDVGNCLPVRPSEGIVYKDEFGDRVFMDNILELSQSVLTLQATTLTIVFQDLIDVDDNPATSEITLNAQRLGVMTVSDLGVSC